MAKSTILVSATFVLFFVAQRINASPQTSSPELLSPQNTEWPAKPPDESLSIANPPQPIAPPAPPPLRYYGARQALTFRVGQDFGDAFQFKEPGLVLGVQYLFPKLLSPRYEAGVDLHQDSIGHFHFGKRWFWHEKFYFRPSAKLSLDGRLDASEKLATLLDTKNAFVRGTGTLEYVIWNPISVRLEVELLASIKTSFSVVSLGLSHGW